MGKGDKKTKRGKMIMGSYGNSRQRKKPNTNKAEPVQTAEKKVKKK
ncbi:30S ribosomal protein THX [Cytophagaceae bacterium ABcell3]|nr:30S ribosomal protein THX [Cytophagaceae bacterium ABcell3]